MKRLALITLLFFALAQPVMSQSCLMVAQDYKAGNAAIDRGDYATAFKHMRPLAEQGDAYAQYWLGALYDFGQGVPQDDAEAVKWYRKAAEQGHKMARVQLGLMYRYGRGVPKDYAKAAKWYRRAAKQGDRRAPVLLAELEKKLRAKGKWPLRQ